MRPRYGPRLWTRRETHDDLRSIITSREPRDYILMGKSRISGQEKKAVKKGKFFQDASLRRPRRKINFSLIFGLPFWESAGWCSVYIYLRILLSEKERETGKKYIAPLKFQSAGSSSARFWCIWKFNCQISSPFVLCVCATVISIFFFRLRDSVVRNASAFLIIFNYSAARACVYIAV